MVELDIRLKEHELYNIGYCDGYRHAIRHMKNLLEKSARDLEKMEERING